jgi:hypothetical protein
LETPLSPAFISPLDSDEFSAEPGTKGCPALSLSVNLNATTGLLLYLRNSQFVCSKLNRNALLVVFLTLWILPEKSACREGARAAKEGSRLVNF